VTLSLVDFLNARLAEDEASARAAEPGPWSSTARHDEGYVHDSDGSYLVYSEGAVDIPTAAHIARYDPARVLREIAAKRAILELFAISNEEGFGGSEGWTLVRDAVRQIAAVYSDHPDYREEWRP
jgi:hypothetical protein